MRIPHYVVGLIALVSVNAVAQSTPAEPPMPTTGLDFTAIDAFWPVVDVLQKGTDPTDAQWQALLRTPGSRLAQIAIGPVLREDLELAFKPSRRTQFDSLTKLTNDRATRLAHLVRAASMRAQLNAFRDSLTRTAPLAEAVRTAARYLPPGATQVGEPPLVAFAIFRNDGYSLGPGVVVDLLNAYEADLVLFLAHEFHHTYTGRAQEAALGAGTGMKENPADVQLRSAVAALRNEGIADLVDKPYPLAWPNPIRAAYVKRYNDEYAKTPETLRQLDSLLQVVADDSTQFTAAGQRARTLLWSNSHANGAYIARTIYERFGVDSLFPAITNPAALLRTYAAAERARGNATPFSTKGWGVIEAFERRYWRRN
jgi:putative zinc-dependent peptidase DUF5700